MTKSRQDIENNPIDDASAGLVPIRMMLGMPFFSKGFGDKMMPSTHRAAPGTGNQSANIACTILERPFDDKYEAMELRSGHSSTELAYHGYISQAWPVL
jgi:hypothetical protein